MHVSGVTGKRYFLKGVLTEKGKIIVTTRLCFGRQIKATFEKKIPCYFFQVSLQYSKSTENLHSLLYLHCIETALLVILGVYTANCQSLTVDNDPESLSLLCVFISLE